MVVEADELDLFIGDTGPTATRKTYPIRQGAKFGLRWKNTLATNGDYNCAATISNGGVANWIDWPALALAGSDVKSYNDTTGVGLGEYKFKIRCEHDTQPSLDKESEVTLRLVSVSEGEI